MVACKDLRLWILMLHPWIGSVRNWHVPARTAPAVTLRRHFLSPPADLEDPTGTHPLLPSFNGIRQKLKRYCSAFSCCFILLFHGNFQLGLTPDDKQQDCTHASMTPVLGVGAQVTPPVLAGGDLGSLGWWCLVKAHKWAADPKHPAISLGSGRWLKGFTGWELLLLSGVKPWLWPKSEGQLKL